MDKILTWDIYNNDDPSLRHVKLCKAAKKRGIDMPMSVSMASIDLPCFVNSGRWVVLCPWCHGAEFAREDGLFMCASCWNSGAQRKYVRGVFPAERLEIEAALVKRLNPANRNWEPGETVEFLLTETLAHKEA